MFADALIILFLVVQTFLGWRRGLLWQAAGVASLVFGVILGLAFSPWLSGPIQERLTSDPAHARLTAFLLVFGLVAFALRMACALAEVSSERGVPPEECERRRAKDRILGGMFGAIKACLLCLVLSAAALTLAPRSIFWKGSKLAAPLANAGANVMPAGAMETAIQNVKLKMQK